MIDQKGGLQKCGDVAGLTRLCAQLSLAGNNCASSSPDRDICKAQMRLTTLERVDDLGGTGQSPDVGLEKDDGFEPAILSRAVHAFERFCGEGNPWDTLAHFSLTVGWGRGLVHHREFNASVLGPVLRRVVGHQRLCFAISGDNHTGQRDTFRLQVICHSIGASLA